MFNNNDMIYLRYYEIIIIYPMMLKYVYTVKSNDYSWEVFPKNFRYIFYGFLFEDSRLEGYVFIYLLPIMSFKDTVNIKLGNIIVVAFSRKRV